MMDSIRWRRIVGLLAVVVLVGAMTACSDDDTPPGSNVIIPSGDGGHDEPDVGTEDADVDEPDVVDEEDADVGEEPTDPCEEVECDDGQVCEEGQCIPSEAGFSCGNPIWIDIGEEETKHVTANVATGPNLYNTTCSSDDQSPQAVFAFTPEVETRLTAHISDAQFVPPLAKELRVGECASTANVEWCSINQQNWIAEGGTDYYLIVEAQSGVEIGELELELKVEPLACEPGARECRDGSVFRCAGGDEEVEHPCPDGCHDGECSGDSCANVLEITGSTTLDVDLSSFHDNVDFSSDTAGCSSSGDGITTSGQDLVLYLPGLTGDEVVEVVRPDSAYAVGAMTACSGGTPSCIFGHSGSDDVIWEVEEPGDYYLVINRFSSSTEQVQFEININD